MIRNPDGTRTVTQTKVKRNGQVRTKSKTKRTKPKGHPVAVQQGPVVQQGVPPYR